VDAARRFIEAARAEAEEAAVANVRFDVMDVERASFGERVDYAFSRMGTMFFASPVAALHNVREALVPGGHLVMVVWCAREENEWLYRAQLITERFVTRPEEYEEPTCGPGPFSMANADTTSGVLVSAGEARRCGHVRVRRRNAAALRPAIQGRRRPRRGGRTDDGPRPRRRDLAPPRRACRAPARADPPGATRGDGEFAGPDGVVAPASAWIVSARAPT